MSIRIQTLGATELRPANTIFKRDYRTAITVGGAAGQVVGSYLAAWVKLPSPFTGNQSFNIFGADTDANGLVNETNQSGLQIGGSQAAISPLRMRYRASALSNSNDAMSQFVAGASYLVIVSPATNIGTNASPVWIQWLAFCAPGGTPETLMVAQNATLTNSSVQAVLSNLFAAASTQGTRTPVGFELEHVAYIDGDFPWDTANNPTAGVTGSGRPHHAALQALAGAGGNPFLDYAGLVAAQNAGTLPYSNLRSNGDAVDPRPGRASVSFWWKLPNLTTLANAGTGGANTLVVTNYNSLSGGLTDGSTSLAPAHWAPAVAAPTIASTFDKFIPGRGVQAFTFGGTYDAVNTTALERRWVLAGTSTPAAGRNWADITGISGGNWSFTETVPIGNYDLVVRDKNTPAQSATSTDWLSGTRVLLHGQSGMALALRTGFGGGNPLGPNLLNVAVDSGAHGISFRLDNMYAEGGAGGTYAPPGPATVRMRPGEAPPNCGHGAILLLNEWNAHNPGHPLMLCNMAINTHGMDQWTANEVIPDGDPTWRFMGPATPTPPGVTNGNASGVVSYFAWLLGSRADLHVVPWLPGLSITPEGRAAYVAAIDARFFNSPNAPWLSIPPWRAHVDASNNDGASGPSIRNRHIEFANELGARGILGPTWMDTVNDFNGSGHAAYNLAVDNPDNAAFNVSDGNQVGQGRLGRSLGRVFAWVYDRKIKAVGPRLVVAYFGDGSRISIVLELGRACRTLNGAALYAGQFWISTNNGNTFINTGFTAALSSDGLRVTLTSTGAAWPATNVRAEVNWRIPFGPIEMPSERNAEASVYGLLYDNQTHRGGINLAAGVRPGNVLQGTSRAGTDSAGLPVTVKGAARLLATERFIGSRTITARMMAADGVTVLREKTLAITAS